jgi:cytosine/uracil/thiamine/allantoin permease
VLLPRRLLIGLYVVVGVVLASGKDYLDSIDTVAEFLSAVLAVAPWPLLLLGVNLHVHL